LPDNNSRQPEKLPRRDLLKSAAVGGLVPLTGAGVGWSADSKSGDNPIVIENRKPGTTDWQLTYMRLDRENKLLIGLWWLRPRRRDPLPSSADSQPTRN
jgi:hypothetical protein